MFGYLGHGTRPGLHRRSTRVEQMTWTIEPQRLIDPCAPVCVRPAVHLGHAVDATISSFGYGTRMSNGTAKRPEGSGGSPG